MQISITFKKIDSSKALKSCVQEKLSKLDRILEAPGEANVVLQVEKIRHIAEINLSSDKLNIYAKEESENMYSAIDAVAEKLKMQIKKNKEKMRRHLSGDKKSIKNGIDPLIYEENPTMSEASGSL